MTELVLAPCVNDSAQKHFEKTVAAPIPAETYGKYTDKDFGDDVYLWGTHEGNSRHFNQLRKGNSIIFYTESGLYTHAASVIGIEENSNLGEEVYDSDDTDYKYIIYLGQPYEINLPSAEFHDLIGYDLDYPLGFSTVGEDRLEKVRDQYGSVDEYLRHHRKKGRDASKKDVKEAEDELRSAVKREPELTEDKIEYTKTKRRARGSAFRNNVENVYDGKCVICGKRRKAPEGETYEAEAAHIYPRGEGGSDDIRNGFTLCKLHHWAFDNGWIAITNNYEIIVRNREDLEGYEEFSDLEGNEINLPDDRRYWPHPKFLEAHRDLHGFSDT